jgi:hypothetical protein
MTIRARVRHEAAAAVGDGGREELPRQHAAEDHECIGRAGRRHVAEPPEYECEDEHREQRTNHAPGNACDGLLVADEQIAPGKEHEELAVKPNVVQVAPATTAGNYHDFFDRNRAGRRHRRDLSARLAGSAKRIR